MAARSFHVPQQPQAGGAPFPLHGGGRNAEALGGFLNRKAAEVAQLDDLALLRIELVQLVERMVQGQHVNGGRREDAEGIIERHGVRETLALGGIAGLGVVDQHAPHHGGRDAHKMRPVAPIHRALTHQPQIGLMHQSGGL